MKENQIVLPPDADGGVSITPPKGCEVDNVKVVDGILTVTFKAAERKLPKTWEEFCDTNPINSRECYFDTISRIVQLDHRQRDERVSDFDKIILPDRSTAEAVIALCQLIQLRNCYNGDWVPDWDSCDEYKWTILLSHEGVARGHTINFADSPLYFKTSELRDEFIANFRTLIEKLKPLYGIKEGGEK